MFFLAKNSAPLWLPGTVHTDTPISWLALCNLIYWPQRLDYKAEIHVPTRGVMSIHSPEQGKKKEKKHTDMHTCINPKHLEAAVNMIDLQRGKRRLPARPVLHGGSQSHTVDRLHTLHGDSITSCSLDAAHENPLQHGRHLIKKTTTKKTRSTETSIQQECKSSNKWPECVCESVCFLSVG